MDGSGSTGAASGRSCPCKVGRVARSRGIDDLDRRLLDRRSDGASLRDLAEYVDVTVLERTLREASADVLGDVDGIYATLAGDDASAGERTEVRERLARAGVDVDALLADFVSHQTVRTHLRDCLGVDTDRRRPLDPDAAAGTIAWARARSEGVIERTLERLARDGHVAAGDLVVSSVVRVACDRCGVAAPVDDFVDRGGCDCGSPGDDEPSARG